MSTVRTPALLSTQMSPVRVTPANATASPRAPTRTVSAAMPSCGESVSVLNSTVSEVAVIDSPGRLSAGVPVKLPQIPVSPAVSVAVMPVRVTAPSPKSTEPSAIATLVMPEARVTVTVPAIRCPATSRTTFSPRTRR